MRAQPMSAATIEAADRHAMRATTRSGGKLPLPPGEIHLWWLEAEQVPRMHLE